MFVFCLGIHAVHNALLMSACRGGMGCKNTEQLRIVSVLVIIICGR